MLDRFYEWCLESPERLKGWGEALFHLGCGLLIAGAIGRIVVIAGSLGPGRAQSLADLQLPFPTFFIPESFLGAAFCVVLAVIGRLAIHSASRYQRIFGA